MASEFDLAGKTALVTGPGSGIARALAQGFALRGRRCGFDRAVPCRPTRALSSGLNAYTHVTVYLRHCRNTRYGTAQHRTGH